MSEHDALIDEESEEVEMMQCGECYGDIDPRATICPHCNTKFTAPNPAIYGLSVLLGVLGLVAIVVGLWLKAWLFFVPAFLLLVAAYKLKQ